MKAEQMRYIAITWSYNETNSHNTYCAIRDAIKENNKALKQILYGLEHAAYNLCDGKKYTDLPHDIIESTCPEETLLISIRNLKILIDEADEVR